MLKLTNPSQPLLKFGLFLILLSSFANKAIAADVNSIRFWKDPEKTRLVFDLSAQVEYQLFTLNNPYRLVVDIDDSQLKAGFDVEKVEKPGDLVKAVRSSQTGNKLRLVIDLKNGVTTKDFTLKPFKDYGHRLVVDLRDKNAEKKVIKTADSSKRGEDRDIIIAIDAGHGGEDPGALGLKKTKEKDIALSVAKRLQTAINKEKGMKAVMTRTGDYYVSLRKRTDIARENKADLFVSLHADAFTDRRVRGASVWVLSSRGANSEIGRWLEKKEKSSDLAGGVNISNRDPVLAEVLLDLHMHHSVKESSAAALEVHKSMSKMLPKMHNKSIQKAGFVVLKMPDIPAMLVEMAFLSNPQEEKALRTTKRQKKITKAVLAGIKNYFRINPPDGSYYQVAKNGRTYKVKSGDTLSQIAVDFGVSMSALKKHNKLKSSQLKIGQVLLIPGI
jgi:N-acetylmuramoyl-L-alanine amidase